MIKLWRWRPLNVCSTLSGDLLVNLIRYNKKKSQIVRYFDSNEKQIMQFDDDSQHLSSTSNLGVICEDRILDICVIAIEAVQ